MLSAALRRSVGLSASGVRTYARGRRNLRPTSGADPGLKLRARAFKEAGVDVPPDADLEDLLQESEADMQNMNLAFDRYVKDSEEEHEKLRHRIVHRKYFAEQMPNLLTWSEKEQIRYLVNECGDEWTPERIAESFPITPEAVKKLIKYPWKPSTVERIERHDNSALRNWKELKQGTLNIPPELREHLLKFSDRTIPPLKESSIKPDISAEKMGEFQSIIEKCAAKERQIALLETKKEENKEQLVIKDDSLNEDKTEKNSDTPKQRDLRRYTLDHLKLNIGRKMAAGKNVDAMEQYIVASSEPKDDAVTQVEASAAIDIVSKVKPEMMAFQEDKQVAAVEIPKRIRIPKAAYKRGRTYRVNDCYYDYDGIFLYRVPGISPISGIKSGEKD